MQIYHHISTVLQKYLSPNISSLFLHERTWRVLLMSNNHINKLLFYSSTRTNLESNQTFISMSILFLLVLAASKAVSLDTKHLCSLIKICCWQWSLSLWRNCFHYLSESIQHQGILSLPLGFEWTFNPSSFNLSVLSFCCSLSSVLFTTWAMPLRLGSFAMQSIPIVGPFYSISLVKSIDWNLAQLCVWSLLFKL